MKVIWQEKLEYTRESEFIKTAAIIVSAGNSTRMGGMNKQFLALRGIPVIARTLLKFQNTPEICEIISVAREEDIPDIQKLADRYNISKLKAVVPGGESRLDSVKNGVNSASSDILCYAVHDGARPLVSAEIISAAVTAAWDKGAAAPGVSLKDTVKFVDKGKITGTVPRDQIMAIQTPQAFSADLFKKALEAIYNSKIEVRQRITDDCQLVENIGAEVYIIPGDYKNLKITTPEDLIFAEQIMLISNE